METQPNIISVHNIFEGNFISTRSLFVYCYHEFPCMTFIDHVQTEKVLEYIKQEYSSVIKKIFYYAEVKRKDQKPETGRTILLLEGNRIVDLVNDYCEMLHLDEDRTVAEAFMREISRFKRKERKKEFEINLISRDSYGLSLKSMDIKKTKLDLNLYYEDELLETDTLLRKRLNKKDDKGIVLLHGLPGTGKTTYLRYLIGKLKKRVLFLSPSMADQLLNPGFMDLLIDNPNSVLIIEDAENIIMDRRSSGDSSVSNLLNISDGLLADFLNVQLICTFNNSVSMIDSALMRKGRLIAKYEFGKLSVQKAQRLSDHLGFDTVITHPMTIAEIANQHEKEHKVGRVEVIGFRKHALEN